MHEMRQGLNRTVDICSEERLSSHRKRNRIKELLNPCLRSPNSTLANIDSAWRLRLP